MADTTTTATVTNNRTAIATGTGTSYTVGKLEPSSATSMATTAIEEVDEDMFLSKSDLLAREEVLKRRSRKLKQIARVYKDHYWSMMEELKLKYKDYYWEFGKSPYQEDGSVTEMDTEKNDDDGLGLELSNDSGRCAVHGCKTKAMALTKFCHSHILSDSKQKLYKGCNFMIKSSQAGPILCGKPILKSTVPSLCAAHFQKAEKHVARALKKAGLNATSTNKVAPKFHVIIAEYVRIIQNKRRIAHKAELENLDIKEEDISI